ncbi:MAG: ribonuclease Z [Desulfatibacillaceae bacterium]|nr:ribonuclease Z [Desulfatibacillaceae bacterium]
MSRIFVTILGSGTCVPRAERSSSSIMVRVADSLILLDTGPGSLLRMAQAGESLKEVTHLFYSHLHLDHTADFSPLLFAVKYGGWYETKKPFTALGGRGFRDFYKSLQGVYGDWVNLRPGLMNLDELDIEGPDKRHFEDFDLFSLPVNHTPQSIGFRLEAFGKSLVYSGDTAPCPELVSLAKNCDLFICEAAMPDNAPSDNHMTPSQAGRAAAQAGAKGLVLTHIYPETDATDIVADCRKAFDGSLWVAQDLMRLAV